MAEPTELPASVPRFDGVDVLRGLSIIAVVIHHTSLRFNFAHVKLGATWSGWLRHLLFWNGNNGVTVFFAVSGFLITMTSIRRFGSLAALQPQLFYRIRFARIAPLLMAVLLVLATLSLLQTDGFVVRNVSLVRAVVSALTFHLNWLEARYGYLPANWDVLWSLSIEEMFYLLFPLLCVLLFRSRIGRYGFFALLLGLIAVGPFARTVWTQNEIWQEKTYLGGTDAIALGCLTALLVDFLRTTTASLPRRQTPLLAVQILGAGMIALIMAWPTWHWYKPFGRVLGRSGLDGTVLPLGTCLVMAASVLRGGKGSRWSEPLRWFGRHSYEIYMTHEFVVVAFTALMLRWRGASPWLWVAQIVAVAAALGWVVARVYSEPANRRLRGAAPPKPMVAAAV